MHVPGPLVQVKLAPACPAMIRSEARSMARVLFPAPPVITQLLRRISSPTPTRVQAKPTGQGRIGHDCTGWDDTAPLTKNVPPAAPSYGTELSGWKVEPSSL